MAFNLMEQRVRSMRACLSAPLAAKQMGKEQGYYSPLMLALYKLKLMNTRQDCTKAICAGDSAEAVTNTMCLSSSMYN